MYLKNLKTIGFKSFADKTSLNFEPGVTAIVGPNGCGKSNISDAIRWVLGEQSAKALRGGEMADVIFAGTEGARSRKPLAMAEVSLTIGDVGEENLKAAGVDLAYNEVTITRRVFRDGGSEYFINNTPCRLRDVKQLFQGTGVGQASYSIMAQGQITRIIESSAQERRVIFEEAAGITKFKQQKKEALRKLDYTDQNIVRLEDLIREVKRQIGSLQRQAGKARRYQKLMDELKHLDTQLARHEFDQSESGLEKLRGRLNELRDEIEGHSGGILEEEEALKSMRAKLSELDRDVSEAQHRGLELKGQIDRHENRLQFNQERFGEIAGLRASASRDIEQANERRGVAEAELTEVNGALTDFSTTLQSARDGEAQRKSALESVDEDLRERQEQHVEARTESDVLAGELSAARDEFNALELQKRGNAVRLEKLSSEKIQLEEERGQLESRLAEFEESVATDRLTVETHRGTVEERQARLQTISGDLGAVENELDDLVQQQAEKRSRREVLQQLVETKEGYGTGAQVVLNQCEQAMGSLADKIQVDAPYVKAVEAALGSNLQLVLMEQPEAARGILNGLAERKEGRASIAALDLITQRNGHFTPDRVPEGARAALSVVQVDDRFVPLAKALLERTFIVDNLVEATEAWRAAAGKFDFVTLAGETLDHRGVYTGGRQNGNGADSLLGRRNEIDVLDVRLGEVEPRIGEVSRRKGALLAEQTDLQATLQNARSELSSREVAGATRQGEFNALRKSREDLAQKIQAVVFEVNSLSEQDDQARVKGQDLSGRIHVLEERKRDLDGRLSGHAAAIERLREAREAANELLTEAKVELANAEQRESALLDRQEPISARLEELRNTIERAQQTLDDCASRKVQYESEDAESRREIERLRGEREVVSQSAASLVDRRNEAAAETESRDLALANRRNSLSDFQEQKRELDVEMAQKQMALGNLIERIQQKYDVNLREVRGECITITITDNGRASVETLSPDEMAAGGGSTDWEAVGARVAELQDRIDGMGPVNLVAIDEYEEVEERYKFLTTQHEDLVNAKQELMEVINRINRQSREMFKETFEKIRTNFQVNFPDLFGGGKADLVLTEGGDVLESGVEIMARPPGTQLKKNSLLSGGQQTMTAVALLFSIYQVQPSPFCVLDELDAPLDDSNIDRFLAKLKSFLGQSQFLIITHNKRTISVADALYGVTMQERGVSRIVSVKFNNAPRRDNLEPEPESNGTAKVDDEEIFLAK
jgi:chromosome segregation protein